MNPILTFMIGFFSGSYLSVFFVSLVVLGIITAEASFSEKLIESLLWPYHLLTLMFGKDEED